RPAVSPRTHNSTLVPLAAKLDCFSVFEPPTHIILGFLAIADFKGVSHCAKTSFRRTGGGLAHESGHDLTRKAAKLVDPASNGEQYICNAVIAQRFDHPGNFFGRAIERVFFRGASPVSVGKHV